LARKNDQAVLQIWVFQDLVRERFKESWAVLQNRYRLSVQFKPIAQEIKEFFSPL